MLRFDVVAHGRVVGALKVPLSKAPVGAIQDEGEKSLVDARFSAAQIQDRINPSSTSTTTSQKTARLGARESNSEDGQGLEGEKCYYCIREPSSSPSIYLLQKITKTRWKGGSQVRATVFIGIRRLG